MGSGATMSGHYVVSLASPEEVVASRAVWNQLVDEMPLATPFATWEWVTTWHEQFGSDAQARVLFVRKGGQLVGILPLACRPGAMSWLGATLEMSGAANVGADHLDLIAASAHAPACAETINAFLRRSGMSWRELRFSLVTEQSQLFEHARLTGGMRTHARARSVAPYLAISGTFDDYLKTLSSNERYKLRSRSRKLLSQPEVSYSSFERDERDRALDLLFSLHRSRSEDKAIVSTFTGHDVESFHRRLTAVMPWDRVVLRGLRQGAHVFAMFYGFRVGGRLFYFQLGYEPAWSAHSPGLVLLTKTIEEAFESGCSEYNFLQGDEPFKRTWTKQSRSLFDVRVYGDGALGALACRAQCVRESLRQWRNGKPASLQWPAEGVVERGQ